MTAPELAQAIMDHMLANIGRGVRKRELVIAIYGDDTDYLIRSARVKDSIYRLKLRESANFDIVSKNGSLTMTPKRKTSEPIEKPAKPTRPFVRAIRKDSEVALSKPVPHPMATGRFYAGERAMRYGR